MVFSEIYMASVLGADEYRRGLSLAEGGAVRILSHYAGGVTASVADGAAYQVRITDKGAVHCECPAFGMHKLCCHIPAVLHAGNANGAMDEMQQERARANAPEILNLMDDTMPQQNTVTMECTLMPEMSAEKDMPSVRIGLRIGDERLYVVRSIPEMLDAISYGENLELGKGFVFCPRWMRFGESETALLEILSGYVAAQRMGQKVLHGSEAKLLLLPEQFLRRVLSVLENMVFRLKQGEKNTMVHGIREQQIPMLFRLSATPHGLRLNASVPKDMMPLTADCTYMLVSGRLIRTAENQRSLLQLLWKKQMDGRSSYWFDVEQTGRVASELVPYLRLAGAVEIEPELEKLLVKVPCQPKIYLDRVEKVVTARVMFVYGKTEIIPFESSEPEKLQKGKKYLLRDTAAEHAVLDELGAAGFRVGRGQITLSGQDKLYEFVTGGVQRLQALSEVYLSNDFRKLTPRHPNLSGHMRMVNGSIQLTFEDDGVPMEELLPVLDALARRKRYFLMKNGTFLDLSAMEEWQAVAEHVMESVAEERKLGMPEENTLLISSCRAFYLSSLLEKAKLPVETDAQVTDTLQRVLEPGVESVKLPKGLSLRTYQQKGFQWMYSLDALHMGGILADDMGLGKTVQVIALLLATHREEETSLVVAPTSLSYNWLRELNRFAPSLSVMVLNGTAQQRANQLRHVQEVKDVDVLITSYPLIRRDIAQMKEMDFRFIILDEAQHIKNAGSVGAVSVKQLKGRTRFALTGTPMENSAAELWSLFDFVLPGYLFGYTSFLKKYQDGQRLDELRQKIRPFLMRRLKKDVLTELPDKDEITLTASMTPEQRRVYQSAMLQLKDRVLKVMDEKGLNRGRADVLSAMMELRQICCHPSLVLADYAGASGKGELLMDILPEALEAGHRVLIFSQFTSMLKILHKQMQEQGWETMYLDGETPSGSRMDMAERFNAGAGQIFLISLKAGGTGLNLTGADMVIHYDPWWNPAAEEQATDRAYRIGQTRKVEVIRLVTHDSIEEQVVALGERKKAIFDQLITPGEEMITALTEKDIRALFT